jgi:hypothetical protein
MEEILKDSPDTLGKPNTKVISYTFSEIFATTSTL